MDFAHKIMDRQELIRILREKDLVIELNVRGVHERSGLQGILPLNLTKAHAMQIVDCFGMSDTYNWVYAPSLNKVYIHQEVS